MEVNPLSSSFKQPEDNGVAKNTIKNILQLAWKKYTHKDEDTEKFITSAKDKAKQSGITQPSQKDFDDLIRLVNNTPPSGDSDNPVFRQIARMTWQLR